MAERRMFAKTIIDSDTFLEMPMSAQALYFHLGMRADDDGFVNSPRRIQRDVGASADDLKLLVAKQFIIPFDSGVIVIRHWRMHNYIQKDRYKPTIYAAEKDTLKLTQNGMYTECIQGVSKLDTQVRVSIGKSKVIDKYIMSGKPDDIVPSCDSEVTECNVTVTDTKDTYSSERKEIIDYPNSVLGTHYTYSSKANNGHINSRLREGHTVEEFKRVIDKKAKAWKEDPHMCQYLRPETLFGSKFEGYLNELDKPVTYEQAANGTFDYDEWNRTHDAFGNRIDGGVDEW